jgi:trans-aconitate methyltransferase
LGKETAAKIKWINADITRWQPQREYDLWHDRAVFHFLTRDTDVEAYKRVLLQGLKPGSHLVMGTFAPEGPDHCSGLPVRRYSSDSLAEKHGHEFELVQSLTEDHTTPAGILQRFLFCRFTRVA